MRYLRLMSLCNILCAINLVGNDDALFQNRLHSLSHPVACKLFSIMWQKKTNLCVAIDVSTTHELLALADTLGPHVCCVKTHIDIVSDFTSETAKQLKQLAQRHNFLILEDRKFCDIGAIVKRQYQNGIYQIAQWADIITVHALTGEPMLEALQSVNPNCALLLIAQMSAKGNLLDEHYAQNVYALASNHKAAVMGFIAQGSLHQDRSWLYFAPGISQNKTEDGNGQQYRDVAAVLLSGIDVVVIGRAICQALDPLATAMAYKQSAWQTYSSFY